MNDITQNFYDIVDKGGNIVDYKIEDDQQPKAEKANHIGTELKIKNPTKKWAFHENYYWQAFEVCNKIPAGFYTHSSNETNVPIWVKRELVMDDLLHLPRKEMNYVLEEFQRFWDLKPKFKERSLLYKRGFLLWGPSGSGKTSILMLMAKHLIEYHNGIVCQLEVPSLSAKCLQTLRNIEPDRPIIVYLEDMDALIQRRGDGDILSLLDGETQIENICFVATTNYPERLDKRLVDRPSRFDSIVYVGMPPPEARHLYLKTKEPSLSDMELEEWVEKSDGFSVAHLKEMLILVKVFGYSLDYAVGRLDKMRVQKNSEDSPDREKVGFLG